MSYKRSTYLINPKFQLRTSVFVCSLSFLASLPYPLIIYSLITNVLEKAHSERFIHDIQAIAMGFSEKKTELLIFLITWQIGFALFIFIICIFQSHKIAGPLYKMKLFLQSVFNGLLPEKLFFRKGDHFKDLADNFNQAFDILREQREKNSLDLNEVDNFLTSISHLLDEEKKHELHQAISKVNKVQNRLLGR